MILNSLLLWLSAYLPPPDPTRTLFLTWPELRSSAKWLVTDRYVGIEPKEASTAPQIRDALLAQGDMDCLVLNYHGTDQGEITLEDRQWELSQLVEELGTGLPTVQKHMVLESCVVGRAPSQMNALANALSAPVFDAYDRYQASKQYKILHAWEERPTTEDARARERARIADEFDQGVRQNAPDHARFADFVLGGEQYLKRAKSEYVDRAMQSASASTEVWFEWFELIMGDRTTVSRRDMLENRHDVRSQAEADALEQHWTGPVSEHGHPGQLIRVHRW